MQAPCEPTGYKVLRLWPTGEDRPSSGSERRDHTDLASSRADAIVALDKGRPIQGSPYLTLHDKLGTLFVDRDFADLYPEQGQPGYPPWRLALVTLMQFREGLSDRQAAEAVRARIDWKYLLGLELSDPGFDFSVLSEFRDRLLAGGASERLLERLLEACRELGLLKARGRQRTDSTHVLAALRVLNRLELVAETLRAALNATAAAAPRAGTASLVRALWPADRGHKAAPQCAAAGGLRAPSRRGRFPPLGGAGGQRRAGRAS